MFSVELQKRLSLLDEILVSWDTRQLILEEDKDEGKAQLALLFQNPCILFRKLEKKKLGYFRNQKCADYLLYEQREAGWAMHVFEFKRTIGISSWRQIKEQLMGAVQNGLAIAGFLGINISLENTYLYSVYRNDKIKNSANPVKQRYQMMQKDSGEYAQERYEWNHAEKIKLDFLGEREFRHYKIPLNIEDGTGRYEITQDEA